MGRAIPSNVYQPPTEQLGGLATTSPVHTQLMAKCHHEKTPYELILGYTPKMHQPQHTGNMPETKERLEQILEARRAAQAATTHAQSQYKDSPHFQPYSEGDKVWLDARNLKTTHPTFKLAPKRYGPFPITKRISVTTYALKLPPQWHIHPVFHASLLMPYKETKRHPYMGQTSQNLLLI